MSFIQLENNSISLLEKAIEANDDILFRNLLRNELAKLLVYSKPNVIEILKNNKIKDIKDYEDEKELLKKILDNKNIIKNDLTSLLVKLNDVNQNDINKKNIILKSIDLLDKNDYYSILSKINSIKNIIENENKYNFFSNIEIQQNFEKKKKIKSNFIAFASGVVISSIVWLIIYLSKSYVNKVEKNENLKSNTNLLNQNNKINNVNDITNF